MLKSEIREIIENEVYKKEAMRKFMSTWDLLKIKDFHLKSDYMVMDKQEFRELVMEVVHETISRLKSIDSNDPESRCLARYHDGKI